MTRIIHGQPLSALEQLEILQNYCPNSRDCKGKNSDSLGGLWLYSLLPGLPQGARCLNVQLHKSILGQQIPISGAFLNLMSFRLTWELSQSTICQPICRGVSPPLKMHPCCLLCTSAGCRCLTKESTHGEVGHWVLTNSHILSTRCETDESNKDRSRLHGMSFFFQWMHPF